MPAESQSLEANMGNPISRRNLLRAGAAAGLAAVAHRVTAAEEGGKPARLGVIGVGSRGTGLLQLAMDQGVDVPALCDVKPAHLDRGVALVAKARRGRRPEGYGKDDRDYRRMLQRDDLDAVLIATPMQWHT